MMRERFLHVVCMTLCSKEQIARTLLSACLSQESERHGGALLFFCDLPDSPAKTLPEDADLIRCVRSGVTRLCAQREGRYFFLVRKRRPDGVLRMHLGKNQQPGTRETLAALLSGAPCGPFEAANFSDDSFAGAFDAVLVTDACASAPPGTAEKMRAQLLASCSGALRGEVVKRAGFSLPPFPPLFSRETEDPPAAIYTPQALAAPAPKETAEGCAFMLSEAPTLCDLFARARIAYARAPLPLVLLPAVQVLTLLLCAFFTWEIPAALALLLPELGALLRPSLLPGALMRLALLPRLALTAVNALLARLFKGRRILLSLSDSPAACAVLGGALLILLLRSAKPSILLPAVSLLWLGAPLLDLNQQTAKPASRSACTMRRA